jgi:hypothetical protein
MHKLLVQEHICKQRPGTMQKQWQRRWQLKIADDSFTLVGSVEQYRKNTD